MLSKMFKNRHQYLMWFWICNFPVAVILYFVTNEQVMLLYTAVMSVYANVESSAAAKEAQGDK